jgi:hypothetical protein
MGLSRVFADWHNGTVADDPEPVAQFLQHVPEAERPLLRCNQYQ